MQQISQQIFIPDSPALLRAYCYPLFHHSLPCLSSLVWAAGETVTANKMEL